MRSFSSRFAIPVLVLAVSFVFPDARAARGQGLSGDLARLQGKWAAYHGTGTGKVKVVLEFKGNEVFTTTGDGPSDKPDTRQEFRINEAAKPKTIDFLKGTYLNAEPGSLKEKLGAVPMGMIYELEGDTLRLAFSLFEKRPASFKPAKGLNVAVYNRGEVLATMPEPGTPKKADIAKPAIFGDLALLQGDWKPKSGRFNFSGPETLKIDGDSLLVTSRMRTGEGRYATRIKLDESASPRTIDFLNPAVGKSSMRTQYGLYILDGDTLTIHKSGRNQPRASVFKKGASNGSVSVWTRATADLKPPQSARNSRRKRVETAAAAGPAEEYRGAVITKVNGLEILIAVDGREVRIGTTHSKNTIAYDREGNLLTKGAQKRVLKVGNKVDVTLVPPAQDPTGLRTIATIRLLEGDLAAPIQYLNSPPPAAR